MTFRLSLFYAAIFLVIGLLVPFWPVWLQSRGMTETEIGLLLAAAMLMRAASNPLVAQAADRHGSRRRMIVILSWGALAAYALFIPAEGFWALLAVGLVASVMFSAMLPLIETVTMAKVQSDGLDYGRMRLWGSLSFILAATLGGWALAGRPDDMVLWMVLAALALVIAAAAVLPDAKVAAAVARRRAPIARLLRDPRFLGFLLCASLLQASHAVYYGFATLHWRAAGHSAGVIGALWAEGVAAEVVLFAFSGAAMARLGPRGLLALAACACVVRWSVLGLSTALPALVAVQFLHAFTFGATHLATMHFIARNVAPEIAATAQSLYSSTAMGVTMGLTMMAAGWLYATYAGGAFFAMAALSLAGGAVAVALAGSLISANAADGPR